MTHARVDAGDCAVYGCFAACDALVDVHVSVLQ